MGLIQWVRKKEGKEFGCSSGFGQFCFDMVSNAMEGIDLGMQRNETILQKMHTMVHKVNN